MSDAFHHAASVVSSRRRSPVGVAFVAVVAALCGGWSAPGCAQFAPIPDRPEPRIDAVGAAAVVGANEQPSAAIGRAVAQVDADAAEAAYRAGQRQVALNAFQRMVELDPGHAHAWLRLGNLHQLRGDIAAAARAYRRAADLPPRDAAASSIRAKALLNLALLGLVRARQALAELQADGLPASLAPAYEDARRRLERFETELDRAMAAPGAAVGKAVPSMGQDADPSASTRESPPIEIRVEPARGGPLPTPEGAAAPSRGPKRDTARGRGRDAMGGAGVDGVSAAGPSPAGGGAPPQVIIGRPGAARPAADESAPNREGVPSRNPSRAATVSGSGIGTGVGSSPGIGAGAGASTSASASASASAEASTAGGVRIEYLEGGAAR